MPNKYFRMAKLGNGIVIFKCWSHDRAVIQGFKEFLAGIADFLFY
jgi:hypothetical protein